METKAGAAHQGRCHPAAIHPGPSGFYRLHSSFNDKICHSLFGCSWNHERHLAIVLPSSCKCSMPGFGVLERAGSVIFWGLPGVLFGPGPHPPVGRMGGILPLGCKCWCAAGQILGCLDAVNIRNLPSRCTRLDGRASFHPGCGWSLPNPVPGKSHFLRWFYHVIGCNWNQMWMLLHDYGVFLWVFFLDVGTWNTCKSCIFDKGQWAMVPNSCQKGQIPWVVYVIHA